VVAVRRLLQVLLIVLIGACTTEARIQSCPVPIQSAVETRLVAEARQVLPDDLKNFDVFAVESCNEIIVVRFIDPELAEPSSLRVAYTVYFDAKSTKMTGHGRNE
jgi:hypothetical protein